MKFVVSSLIFSLLVISGIASAKDQTLFNFKGKSYKGSDLDPDSRQDLYEAERFSFEKTKEIIDDAVFNTYLAEEAKKKGKSEDDIRKEVLKISTPSESEMKSWYEANKARIPYPYEKINGEIAKLLSSEQAQGKKKEIVDRIKKEGKFKLALTAPQAPVFSINTDGYPSKGKKGSKVVLVEFADYQCPHCKAASDVLKKVFEKYKTKMQLVYIDFPINRSGISRKVAEGGVCADQQKKYWEYHYMAFDMQKQLSDDSPMELAKKLKLNEKDFEKCLNSTKTKEKVAQGKKEGERIGVKGTPAIFINGRKIANYDEKVLSNAIENAMKGVM